MRSGPLKLGGRLLPTLSAALCAVSSLHLPEHWVIKQLNALILRSASEVASQVVATPEGSTDRQSRTGLTSWRNERSPTWRKDPPSVRIFSRRSPQSRTASQGRLRVAACIQADSANRMVVQARVRGRWRAALAYAMSENPNSRRHSVAFAAERTLIEASKRKSPLTTLADSDDVSTASRTQELVPPSALAPC